MTPSYETLILDAGPSAQAALTPGAIQRALCFAAQLRSEDLGPMAPIARGKVAVEVAATRASRVPTPLPLQLLDERGALSTRPSLEPRRPVLVTLRRDDDPPFDEVGAVTVRWSDGGPPPSPGALSAALAGVLAGAAGAESVGVAFFGDGFGQLSLPASLATSRRLPTSLDVAGRRLELEPQGKKKP